MTRSHGYRDFTERLPTPSGGWGWDAWSGAVVEADRELYSTTKRAGSVAIYFAVRDELELTEIELT